MYDGPQLSRQNQTPHGKSKNFTAKPKTSRQNQIPHSKNTIGLVLPWVFAFAVRYLVFAVKYLVLPWGIWFLLWSIWFCREVFGFAVNLLVLSLGILFLPWGFRFCREVFGFAVTVVGHRIYEIKTKIFWLKEYRVFCTEKYNSAPSYLRDS